MAIYLQLKRIFRLIRELGQCAFQPKYSNKVNCFRCRRIFRKTLFSHLFIFSLCCVWDRNSVWFSTDIFWWNPIFPCRHPASLRKWCSRHSCEIFTNKKEKITHTIAISKILFLCSMPIIGFSIVVNAVWSVESFYWSFLKNYLSQPFFRSRIIMMRNYGKGFFWCHQKWELLAVWSQMFVFLNYQKKL